ncbi:MAG TPA: hypothetical protein VGX94_09490 [Terriglobia bacterium]|nr:hypothetical protein [Terriglobia bacterium]
MIIDLRHIGAGGPDLSSVCSHYQEWTHQDVFVPAIENAFDTAEVLACGHGGCATSGANTRIIVVNQSGVNGWVVGDFVRHSVDIFLTYGLLDFVDSANAALTQQLLDQTLHESKPGIIDWLSALDKRGGQPCALGMPRPARVDWTQFGIPSEQGFLIQMGGDSAVLTFIFLHELAHLLTGGSCHENPSNVLKMELSCDQQARQWFLRGPVAPTSVIAWMVTVDDYQSLEGPVLNQEQGYGGPNQSDVRMMFPASDWKLRSDLFLVDWKAHCLDSPQEGECRSFSVQFQMGKDIAAVPKPSACIPH